MCEAIEGWNKVKIAMSLLQEGVTGIINPPVGSHSGGIWERQISSVRRSLTQLLNQQILDDKRLHTLFCEVESIVKGRHITRVIKDIEALIPNHLLIMKRQHGHLLDCFKGRTCM